MGKSEDKKEVFMSEATLTGIYNAGPLFSSAEQTQRKSEGKMLGEYFKKHEIEQSLIFNPIDLPHNDGTARTNYEIFINDYNLMEKANVFIFDVAEYDSGTMFELGYAIGRAKKLGNVLRIYPVISDFRAQLRPSGDAIPGWGVNEMLTGSFADPTLKDVVLVVNSFEEVIQDMESRNLR